MRNLKKVLSLSLALVMLLGLMVVGAGAATTYTDADDITYTEAVDVMSAIGVFSGSDTGDFQPNGDLTREQAAKIITYMLLGQTAADALTTNTAPFQDVAANRWSAGSIAYCVNMGIIAGDGNGHFYPTQTVNGYAFAKMLLVALGYDATVEGYTGTNWAINVASDASSTDLTAGLDVSLANTLTREQAAQMAFNALKATMVEYDTTGMTVTTPDGTVVSGGASRAEAITTTKTDYAGRDDDTLQFCEQYFSDLTLDNTSGDSMGRTANIWALDDETIGTYPAGAAFTYTASVNATNMRNTLRSYNLDNVVVVTNGEPAAAAALTTAQVADLTGNGVEVSIYADGRTVEKIVVVNSYLAQVTSVSSRNETITVELIAAEDNEANADGIAITTGEGYGDYEEDDYVIVIPAYDTDGDVATGNDSAIYGIAAAEVITGSVTSTTNNSLTVGGTTYSAAANSAVEVGSTFLTEQNVYLDTYGYVVNVSETTAAASNLLYVVRGWNASDSYGDETHYAQVVLTDGTTAVYETNTLYNNPGLYSYTSSRDVYTLTQIYQGSDDSDATYGHVVSSVTLTTNSRRFTGTSHYFADDVQFIAVNGSGSSLDVTVYDGVRALTNASYVYYVTTGSVAEDESGTITTVFVPNVLSGSASGENLIYVQGTYGSTLIDGETYTTYTVWIDGEEEHVAIDGGFSTAGLYTYEVDDNGVYSVDEATASNGAAQGEITAMNNSYLTVGDLEDYDVSDATIIDLRNGDEIDASPVDEITSVTALRRAVNNEDVDEVTVSVVYDSDDATISYVFVESVTAAGD